MKNAILSFRLWWYSRPPKQSKAIHFSKNNDNEIKPKRKSLSATLCFQRQWWENRYDFPARQLNMSALPGSLRHPPALQCRTSSPSLPAPKTASTAGGHRRQYPQVRGRRSQPQCQAWMCQLRQVALK